MFPKLPQNTAVMSSTYDSKTKFKTYLVAYLEYYQDAKLNNWIQNIKHHDMSSAK